MSRLSLALLALVLAACSGPKLPEKKSGGEPLSESPGDGARAPESTNSPDDSADPGADDPPPDDADSPRDPRAEPPDDSGDDDGTGDGSDGSDGTSDGNAQDPSPISVSSPPPPQTEQLPRADAAMLYSNGKLYFFRDASYWRYDFEADTVSNASPAYPRPISGWWPGLWESGIDAAVTVGDGTYFFKGDEYVRYDHASDRVEDGFPLPIAGNWPGLWPSGIDAAVDWGPGLVRFIRGDEFIEYDTVNGTALDGYPKKIAEHWPDMYTSGVDAAVSVDAQRNYFFLGNEYIRYARDASTYPDAYPLSVNMLWAGLWDPHEGTGAPGANLPTVVADLLASPAPSTAEITARKEQVRASIGSDYEDISSDYPEYLASVEERLGAYGCLLLKRIGAEEYRFRCASHTQGIEPLAITRYRVHYIDWLYAAYHEQQTSQGDFLADAGTPLSIFHADNDEFTVDYVLGTTPSTVRAGVRIKVSFSIDGEDKSIQFSHCSNHVPQYVLDAASSGEALPVGTVVGFVGYTGNLWIGPPPATDGPYAGGGENLPTPHAHVWFVQDPDNHMALTRWARRALDYTGTYFYGGG